jgi:hypothetical protein
MIVNRSHLPWALLIATLTAIIWIVYAESVHPGAVPQYSPAYIPIPAKLGQQPYGHRSVGATPVGIAYGTAAFGIFIFAALLGARKKVRHWRIGRAELWMRGHIWLSVLTIPLIAFHCGMHSGSAFTTGLLVLYAVVMLSGFYGLALQQFIPRQMMERLTHEVIYEQMPYLREQLFHSALALRGGLAATPATVQGDPAALGRAALREALDRDILPYLRAANGSRHLLGRPMAAENLFAILKATVAEDDRPRVEAVCRWCDQRREMDLQARMQHWLHYWLFVHLPTSMLLLLWTAWHAVTALYYF